MKIATWNVNGIRARLKNLVFWLQERKPDIVCLQETKTVDEYFPSTEMHDLGYHIAKYGQKGFNGVAILSKYPFDEVNIGLFDDPSARFIEGIISTKTSVLRIVSLYAPNGNPIYNCSDLLAPHTLDSEKFSYKLNWMKNLNTWLKDRLLLEEPLIVSGDFNIIPEARDAKTPKNWTDNALFQPQAQKAFRMLENFGLIDSVRYTTDSDNVYTFWDYQAGAWKKNEGVRIDHILLTPESANYLESAFIEKKLRNQHTPSDHVPLIINLSTLPFKK